MRVLWLLTMSLMIQYQLLAVSLDLSADIPSRFADKVSVFDAELPAHRFDGMRQFKLTITLHACVTNSICVRLGRDGMFGTRDGLLSMEETLCELGIDRNEFVLRGNRFKERYIHTPADPGTTRQRTLVIKMRVSSDDPADVRSLSFEEDGTPFVFEGLSLDPFPYDLNPALWTDLRLLVRNGGAQSVEIKFMKDGSLIIVR